MIKHIVLFKYKADSTPAQQKAMVDGLEALPGLIPEIKRFDLVPTVHGRPARFYHVALISEFESVAALDAYIANEHHQRVVALIEAACESRAAFDYEV
jgi:quinol monooxygenase YgiN